MGAFLGNFAFKIFFKNPLALITEFVIYYALVRPKGYEH